MSPSVPPNASGSPSRAAAAQPLHAQPARQHEAQSEREAEPLAEPLAEPQSERARTLDRRLAAHRDALRGLLASLYGGAPDFDPWFQDLLDRVAELHTHRADDLRSLDAQREARPRWITDPGLVAYSAYVDRLGGTLRGVAARLDDLQDLGVRVLHLLPFLAMRPVDNDGGFAVSDFGRVDPRLGTNDDLFTLCAELRRRGMSLMADAVINHVADDHPWAAAARAGDPRCQGFFHWVDGAAEVAARERELGQSFPDQAPGNFTHVPALGRWVWTTFYPYQWDLNWANREVFAEMALAMVRLANLGVEIFRVDAAPHIWKRAGTDCRNLPEVHTILRAIRLLLRIAAPATALNAEALLDARDVLGYFGPAVCAEDAAPVECSMAYGAGLMAAAWVSLARGDAVALRAVLEETPPLPPGCTWLAYVRCHDDILWSVVHGVLERAGLDADAMIAAASTLLDGATPGSFSRGVPSQAGTDRHCGTSGMTAELVGLTAAADPRQAELALRRYALMYGLMYFLPGMPLIYCGDEIGQGNADVGPGAPRRDTRWLHRPRLDVAAVERARRGEGAGAPVFALLRELARARAGMEPVSRPEVVPDLPDCLLGLIVGRRAAVFNLADREVVIDAPPALLRRHAPGSGAPLRIPALGRVDLG